MKYARYSLWALVGLAFIGFIFINLPQKTDVETGTIMPIAGFNKGVPFTLKSHTGRVFNSKNEFNDGELGLMFFGFTHCPVICPTELQKFAQIMDDLPADIADKITPIFITVDPERDTVETLQAYVPLFHEKIVGLSGDVETVHKVLDDWKVFYTKVEDPQYTEYTMDHSTYVYLIDHEMNIKALYRMNNTSEQIIDSIQKMVR